MKFKKHRSNSKLKFIAGIICWGLYMVVFVVLDVLLDW